MTIYRLPREPIFPPVSHAEDDGLLAVGGDLSPERLLMAYRCGIFPWFSDDSPLLWWAPDPRFVITPETFRLGRTLRKELRSSSFRWTLNRDFSRVMQNCASQPRPGQDGTWITEEMLHAYLTLHEMGYAHSVEVWLRGELVGGLYGLSIAGAFFGESMFSLVSNASKFAFSQFASELFQSGWTLIDCQIETEHLERFGAFGMPRVEFMRHLEKEGVNLHHRDELLVSRRAHWGELV